MAVYKVIYEGRLPHSMRKDASGSDYVRHDFRIKNYLTNLFLNIRGAASSRLKSYLLFNKL